MELSKVLSTFIVIFLLIPIASAIYIGEAESEPSMITLTIEEEKPPINEERNGHDVVEDNINDKEDDLHEVAYSDWICINHRFQRTITLLNRVEYEYGQACSINEENTSAKSGINGYLLILNILLIMLSLIHI